MMCRFLFERLSGQLPLSERLYTNDGVSVTNSRQRSSPPSVRRKRIQRVFDDDSSSSTEDDDSSSSEEEMLCDSPEESSASLPALGVVRGKQTLEDDGSDFEWLMRRIHEHR